MGQHVLSRVDVCEQVDVEQLVPFLASDLFSTVDYDAGVRTKHVDPSVHVECRLHQVGDILFNPDVGGDRRRPSYCGGLFRRRFEAEIAQHDLRSFACESSAQPESNAARTTGHDYYLAFDVHCVSSSVC